MDFSRTFFSLVLAVGVTACKQETPKPEPEPPAPVEVKTEIVTDRGTVILPMTAQKPIAKVNGQEIPAAKFNTEIERLAKMAPQMPREVLNKFKEQTIERLIDQELIEGALKDSTAQATEQEVNDEMANFFESVGGEEQANEFFQKTGVTRDELRADLERAIRLKKLLREKYAIVIDDASIKAYYDENKPRFTREEEIHARHILFKVDPKDGAEAEKAKEDKAKEVLKLAKGGGDFAELARTHSEGPTAPRGGDLGFFSRNKMIPSFAEAAFAAKNNEIIGPVKTEFGFHIIQVLDRRAEGEIPLDEVKKDIANEMEQGKLRESLQAYQTEIRAAATIERFDDAIVDNPNYVAEPQQMKIPLDVPGMGIPAMPQGGQAPAPQGGHDGHQH